MANRTVTMPTFITVVIALFSLSAGTFVFGVTNYAAKEAVEKNTEKCEEIQKDTNEKYDTIKDLLHKIDKSVSTQQGDTMHIREKVDDLEEKLDEHMEDHNGNKTVK